MRCGHGRGPLTILARVSVHVLDMPQPVVDEADALVLQRRGDAAAAVVPADDDVLDLQHLDRELDHRQAVEIRVDNDVGDVAVNEELARQEPDDLVGRHAAVGAADPEVLGDLLARSCSKNSGFLLRMRSDQARLFSKRDVRELIGRSLAAFYILRALTNGAFLHPEVSPGPRR